MASCLSCMNSSRQFALFAIFTLALMFLICQYQSEYLVALFDIIIFAAGSIFSDIIIFMITAAFCALGLKFGASKQAASAVRHCLPKGLIGASKTCNISESLKSRGSYTVCAPSLQDVTGLQLLYNQEYVQAHIQMHPSVTKTTSIADWEEALGHVDFEAIIRAQLKSPGDVRLLKCIQIAGSVPPEEQPPLGYILYELRTKGSPGKKPQRYCEVVNVVVGKKQQGNGLGRLLFEEMVADIEKSARPHSGDLRLFVAKANVRPLDWYRRLSFQDAGWQKECVGGKTEVSFLRMTRKSPLP